MSAEMTATAPLSPAAECLEGALSREGSAQGQRMNLVGPFVRVGALEVQGVPDHVVVRGDAVGAQERAGLAGRVERRLAAVSLEEAHLHVMERLGLGFDKLKEINPKLVYCAIY